MPQENDLQQSEFALPPGELALKKAVGSSQLSGSSDMLFGLRPFFLVAILGLDPRNRSYLSLCLTRPCGPGPGRLKASQGFGFSTSAGTFVLFNMATYSVCTLEERKLHVAHQHLVEVLTVFLFFSPWHRQVGENSPFMGQKGDISNQPNGNIQQHPCPYLR